MKVPPVKKTLVGSDDGNFVEFNSEPNSMQDLMKFFGVGIVEFGEFWESLSWPEKMDYVFADLSK